jgi:membrane protein implicated in regulation of membrane protease activity
VVTIAVAVLLALFVLPGLWGAVAVAGAVVWEVLEKAFWCRRTRGIPVAVGAEAMIGRRVAVVASCRPEGKVQLSHERWNARCGPGAEIGDTVVVEAIDRLTLIVSPANGGNDAANAPGEPPQPQARTRGDLASRERLLVLLGGHRAAARPSVVLSEERDGDARRPRTVDTLS